MFKSRPKSGKVPRRYCLRSHANEKPERFRFRPEVLKPAATKRVIDAHTFEEAVTTANLKPSQALQQKVRNGYQRTSSLFIPVISLRSDSTRSIMVLYFCPGRAPIIGRGQILAEGSTGRNASEGELHLCKR